MITSFTPTPSILRKRCPSVVRAVSPAPLNAPNRLGTTLTSQADTLADDGSLKTSSGVWLSLPGQNGQDSSRLGSSWASALLGICCGRLALSGAIITHSLVVGSCLISDMLYTLIQNYLEKWESNCLLLTENPSTSTQFSITWIPQARKSCTFFTIWLYIPSAHWTNTANLVTKHTSQILAR